MRMQEEADELKAMTSGGAPIKVIALGISDKIDQKELRDIASSPYDIIHVDDFSSLSTVEDRLRDDACKKGKDTSLCCCY